MTAPTCGDIVNFFRVIQRHAPEFLRMFAYSIARNREGRARRTELLITNYPINGHS